MHRGMPDYIYLLENRLSPDQQSALRQIAQAARAASMNVFLTGGAVRDLTSGSSVRDLDVSVQGNTLKLKKPLSKCGATLWGEHEASRTLFYRFPASVRVEISSTRREEYPKPGKPVYHWASILEDLRRRDFTANAMALSLNEGSYGLLMDPLNGVADIEARILRLVSNYGFLEEPARLLRATRLALRLGWELEERTKARFQSARDEGVIESLSNYQRGYELEEIGHEEDALDALTVMEREGWMRHLYPAWTRSKADTAGLGELRRLLTQLQMHGIYPDPSAASMQLLTAKLPSKELTALKKMFVRPGFVEEWNHLDSSAREFAKRLTSREATSPSATWKLLTTANPQAVLWLGLISKAVPVQNKYKNFFTVWPEARQKIPFLLMQEMRITPELPKYQEMMDQLFLGTIDGKLETDEQLRAFLEPYSPPAPPPPVTVRRTKSSRKTGEAKAKVASLAESEAGEPRKEAKGEEISQAEALAGAEAPAAGKRTKPPAKAAPVAKAATGKGQAAKQAGGTAPEAAARGHKGAPAPAAKKSAASKAVPRKPAAGSAVKPAPKLPAQEHPSAKARKKPAAGKKAAPAKKTKPAKKH